MHGAVSSSHEDSSYEAIGIHRDLAGGKSSGLLFVDGRNVSFRCDSVGAQLPISGLKIKFGGARNRLVFFSHPNRSDWSIYTSDKQVLAHEALRDHPDLPDEVRRLRREKHAGLTMGLLLLVICGGILSALYFAKSPIVMFLADRVPLSVERGLGQASFAQLTAASRKIQNPEVKAGLARLSEPLLSAVTSGTDIQFELHVIEDGSVNAFAMPGGFIVIHTALLLQADRPEEIIGVLAHEVAHVTRRHSVRQIISTLGFYTIVSTLLGDISGLTALLIDSGTMLATLQFSRDFEREADDVGWGYLTDAGIDPRGMITFFERIQDIEPPSERESTSESVSSILSSHPATQERIAYLKGKLETYNLRTLPIMRPDEFLDFQQSVRVALNLE